MGAEERKALSAAFERLRGLGADLAQHWDRRPEAVGSPEWIAWDRDLKRLVREWGEAHRDFRAAHKAFGAAIKERAPRHGGGPSPGQEPAAEQPKRPRGRPRKEG